MREARLPTLEKLSAEVARQTEAFLKAGGKISRPEVGTDNPPAKCGWQEQAERTAKRDLGDRYRERPQRRTVAA